MSYQLDPMTRLVQECNPNEDLEPSDKRWVNFDEARGGNIIDSMARSIRRAKKPIASLFAGHRGIGKTTELRRLKANLEKSPQPLQVIFIDVTRYLDINDIDYPDLLALLAGNVQTELRNANISGFSGISTYLKRLWDDFKGLLGSHVELKDADVEVPFGKLALEIKNRPSGRQLLREKFESLTTSILGAFNDLLDEANLALKKVGKAGLVLIIDGLDKVVRRQIDKDRNTHDRLFIDRCEQLVALRAHTIYTVPISLLYSPQSAFLEQCFGDSNKPISMIRVRDGYEGKINADTLGLQKLWEMLDLRCKAASVQIDDVFDHRDTLNHLCIISGGHPRHLLSLLCSAANTLDELPITRNALDLAIRDAANSALREIPGSLWEKLSAYDKPSREMPKDDEHQEMLFLLWVFEYMNGSPWYEINPIVRTLDRFQQQLSQ